MNITEHFHEHEVKCRCCGQLPKKSRRFDYCDLAHSLEDLRELCGNKPIHVISWYRCPEHNKAVGGSENSKHMLGTAADIIVPTMHPYELYKLAHQSNQFDGMGIYPAKGIVHVHIVEDNEADLFWLWMPRDGYQYGTYQAVCKAARREYQL